MNNMDKIVLKNLRKKYFRPPAWRDISVEFKTDRTDGSYSIRLCIGAATKYQSFEVDTSDWSKPSKDVKVRVAKNKKLKDSRKQMCKDFNKNKNVENLQKICDILEIKNMRNLVKAKFENKLLTREGVEFTKVLCEKLIKTKEILEQACTNMKAMQPEIAVFNPQAQSIYNEENNRHINDLEWLIRDVRRVLQINSAE
jgi:hypothetical protein